MYLANLSFGGFLALFGAVGGAVVVLYLLDKSRRRQVVSSLRFWQQASTPVQSRRWRIREPWSLLLQLLGIALLLLAVAQLRTGAGENASRDHVLMIETSAWMDASPPGGTLMDQARSLAKAYVDTMPAADRVLVLRAGGLVTPVTSFESDRKIIAEAIRTSAAGSGAVNLQEALGIAARIRRQGARRAGEIVYVGTGRTSEEVTAAVRGLRFLRVGEEVDNVGLRRVGLRRSPASEIGWEVYVRVRNYTPRARQVNVGAQFASSPAMYRTLKLAPHGGGDLVFPLRTTAAGSLEIRVFANDDFEDDNFTSLEIPSRKPVRVAVYSDTPPRLRPLIEAGPLVKAAYYRPGTPLDPDAGLVVLDRCAPAGVLRTSAIWIEPPPESSPIPVRRRVRDAAIREWSAEHPVAGGLRSGDVRLATSLVFAPEPSDTVVARTAAGAVVVARGAGKESARMVVLGFDPTAPGVRYRLAAPLLFANMMQWLRPALFRRWELNSRATGTISADLGPGADPETLRIVDDEGEDLPYSIAGGLVHFFAGRPGTVRLTSGDQELVYSLHLPAMPEVTWEPPAGVARGIPKGGPQAPPFRDWWPWLALAGGLILVAEWWQYGRARRSPGGLFSLPHSREEAV